MKFWFFVIIGCVISTSYSQEISFTHGFGQLAPHHSSMNYLVEGHANNFQLNYSEKTSDKQLLSYHGGVMITGNPKVLGQIYYGYTSLDNFFGKKKKDVFAIGLGVGYVTKPFDPNSNNKNIAIGSHINAAIEFAYNRKLIENRKLNWDLGVSFKHFSNGSYQTPNLGLNFLTLTSQFSISLSDKVPSLPYYRDSSKTLKKFIYSSIGIHENVNPDRGKYPLVALSAGISKKQTKQFTPIIGIDGFYNPANIHFDKSYSTISPFQVGVFIGNEFDLSLVKISANMGVYAFNEYKLRGMIYHKLVVDRQINKHFSALLVLKTHWAIAESFMIGIGYKF